MWTLCKLFWQFENENIQSSFEATKRMFRAGLASDIETVIHTRGGNEIKLSSSWVQLSGHTQYIKKLLCQCQVDLQQPKKKRKAASCCSSAVRLQKFEFFLKTSQLLRFLLAHSSSTFTKRRWCFSQKLLSQRVNEKPSVGNYQLYKQERKLSTSFLLLPQSIDVRRWRQ